MITLDHILIATENLSEAKARCERLGFRVAFGGTERRALNALIFLKDGTLIELIGKDRFPMIVSFLRSLRLTRLFGLMIDRIAAFPRVPSGLFNISFRATDLHAAYERLRKNRIRVSGPTRLSRKRDDGVTISWELLGTAPYDLPFIIGDYHPGRLSDESLMEHPNGATGIDSVTIGCRDLARYVEIYRAILEAQPVMATRDGRRCADFVLAGSIVTLVESRDVGSIFTFADGSFPLAFAIRHSRNDATVESVAIGARDWTP